MGRKCVRNRNPNASVFLPRIRATEREADSKQVPYEILRKFNGFWMVAEEGLEPPTRGL